MQARKSNGNGRPNGTIRCACGKAAIPTPQGATERTTYTCPACCRADVKVRGPLYPNVNFTILDIEPGELESLTAAA